METQAPSLGDKIAHLRRTAQAQEKCVWIPSAIHTLIMAALARIFGRLEQIFQLWQSGTLPTPPADASRAPARARPVRPPAAGPAVLRPKSARAPTVWPARARPPLIPRPLIPQRLPARRRPIAAGRAHRARHPQNTPLGSRAQPRPIY